MTFESLFTPVEPDNDVRIVLQKIHSSVSFIPTSLFNGAWEKFIKQDAQLLKTENRRLKFCCSVYKIISLPWNSWNEVENCVFLSYN